DVSGARAGTGQSRGASACGEGGGSHAERWHRGGEGIMAGSFGGYWDQFDPHVEGPPSGTVPQSAGGAIGAAVGSAIPTPAPPTQQPQSVASNTPPAGDTNYQATFQ